MKLYLYDWDGTIYDGDSSLDFILYCIKKNKKLILFFTKKITYFFKYLFKFIDITQFKEEIFSFLKTIDDVDKFVEEFWEQNKHKIKKFYLDKKHDKDIIISHHRNFY